MKKRTNIILQTMLILLAVLFSNAINNDYSHLWLAFIYTLVYVSIFSLTHRSPFLILIAVSIILDSIYGMTLGFSAVIFISFALLLKLKMIYIKQLGSVYSHCIFFIALGLVSIFSIMSKYLLDMHFVNIGYYILFSVILYPIIYFIIQTLSNSSFNNEK